jgi:hypothetical protein
MITTAVKSTAGISEVSRVTNLLKYIFTVVPIVAGLDKFTNILTDWSSYLSPQLVEMIPFSASTFMLIVGVVEIAAGVIVLLRPRIGGYIVAAWLVLIAISLLLFWHHPDVAVRDLVMAAAAFSLARLSTPRDDSSPSNG